MRLRPLPLRLPRPLHGPTSPPRHQNNRQLNVQKVSRGPVASESFPQHTRSGVAPGALVWSVTALLASYRRDSRDSVEWSLPQAKHEASEKPGPSLHFAFCTNNSCRTPETSGGTHSPQRLSMETQKGLQYSESSPGHLVTASTGSSDGRPLPDSPPRPGGARSPGLCRRPARQGCGFRRTRAS